MTSTAMTSANELQVFLFCGTTTKLFVGNITRGANPEELRAEFARFGTVAECDIISDYGFVHYRDPAEADAALEGMHGAMFNGQNLKVEKSTSYVRKRAGDGNMSAESCYVCGKGGHWAKNCPQVPEHERDKQMRRSERSRRGGREDRGFPPGGRGRRPPRDYYDDYDDYDYPPRRRRPPPPDYYDDYDDFDYYPRRRPPPPRYYDPYDYDYPPPRRLPPPGYYRMADPYPPPRRLPYDDYPPPLERVPQPVAAPKTSATAAYYDFADDNIDKQPRPVKDIDPLATDSQRAIAVDPLAEQSRFAEDNADKLEIAAGNPAARALDRYPPPDRSAGPERLGPERLGPERLGPEGLGPERLGPERLGPAERERYPLMERERYAAPGPDRFAMDYYRRAPRPY